MYILGSKVGLLTHRYITCEVNLMILAVTKIKILKIFKQ